MSRIRIPAVDTEGHVTVRCAANGPEVEYIDGTAFAVTIGDLALFVQVAREQGASEDTVVENVYGDGPRGRESVAAQVCLQREVEGSHVA